MSYAEFQDHWEKAAEAELAKYRALPVEDLLAEITRGKYGSYYQIWYALQGRTTIEQAGEVALSVLRSGADYLVRYHCATLLLSLHNPFPDVLTPAKLSARNKFDVSRHLDEYEEALSGKR